MVTFTCCGRQVPSATWLQTPRAGPVLTELPTLPCPVHSRNPIATFSHSHDSHILYFSLATQPIATPNKLHSTNTLTQHLNAQQPPTCPPPPPRILPLPRPKRRSSPRRKSASSRPPGTASSLRRRSTSRNSRSPRSSTPPRPRPTPGASSRRSSPPWLRLPLRAMAATPRSPPRSPRTRPLPRSAARRPPSRTPTTTTRARLRPRSARLPRRRSRPAVTSLPTTTLSRLRRTEALWLSIGFHQVCEREFSLSLSSLWRGHDEQQQRWRWICFLVSFERDGVSPGRRYS